MDNPAFTTNDDIIINHIEYGPYEREIIAPNSNANSSNNLTIGYLRSSSSSSSNASSGKQLVKSQKNQTSPKNLHQTPHKGRLEKGYNHRDERAAHPKSKRDVHSISPAPEVHKMSLPKFYIGSASSSGSSTRSDSPERLGSSPESPSSLANERFKPHYLKPPDHHHLMPPDPHLAQLHPGMLTVPEKSNSIYDTYWHIPRASLWCTHTRSSGDDQKCAQCQMNEETISNCSSINPPPTFTAMDNYQPIRRKNTKCFCGAVFLATTAFSTFVLLLIAAFILYIEMVLKRTEYVPDLM